MYKKCGNGNENGKGIIEYGLPRMDIHTYIHTYTDRKQLKYIMAACQHFVILCLRFNQNGQPNVQAATATQQNWKCQWLRGGGLGAEGIGIGDML